MKIPEEDIITVHDIHGEKGHYRVTVYRYHSAYGHVYERCLLEQPDREGHGSADIIGPDIVPAEMAVFYREQEERAAEHRRAERERKLQGKTYDQRYTGPQEATMNFTYSVDINVERTEGKFASKDEIQEAIYTQLEEAVGSIDISGVGPDGESTYEITDHTVDQPVPVPRGSVMCVMKRGELEWLKKQLTNMWTVEGSRAAGRLLDKLLKA